MHTYSFLHPLNHMSLKIHFSLHSCSVSLLLTTHCTCKWSCQALWAWTEVLYRKSSKLLFSERKMLSKRIFRCNWLREKEKRRDYLQKPAKYMGEKSQSKPFPLCNPSPVPYYLIPNCTLCPHSKVTRPEGNRQYWFTASPSLKSSAGITRALKGVISSEEQVHAPSRF